MLKKNQTRNKLGAMIVGISLIAMVDFATAEEDKLTSQEIKQLLTENTIRGVSKRTGYSYIIYYKSEKKIVGKSASQRDKGTWSVSDDEGYCQRWRKWLGGKKNCFAIVKEGEKFQFLFKNGKVQSNFGMEKGNSGKL